MEHIVLRVFHAVSSAAYLSKCTVTVMAACNFCMFDKLLVNLHEFVRSHLDFFRTICLLLNEG